MQKTTKLNSTTIDWFDIYANIHSLSKNEFRLILKTFNYLLAKAVLEGKHYYLPHACGTISIRKRKQHNKPSIDYQLFKETGLRVKKRNLHTDGYVASIIWKVAMPHRVVDTSLISIFKFKPARAFNRTLAKLIKEKNYMHKYYDD